MKKNRILHLSTLLLGLGLLLINYSCKKDDPKPKAGFFWEQDANNPYDVIFTNESKDAKTYAWDFGDGTTSTEESPTHTYAEFKTYTVKLTATGDGGTNEFIDDAVEVKKPSFVMDGKFDDWAETPALVSKPDGEGRTFLELRVDNDATYLFFYIKGTSNMGEVIQVFINANNDTLGWGYWNFFETPGLEYMMEAVMVPFGTTTESADLFAATGADINWPWEKSVATAIASKSSYVVDGDSKIVEFSMLRDLFTTPALSGTIGIIVGNSNSDWQNVGHLPPSSTDPLTPPASYTLK